MEKAEKSCFVVERIEWDEDLDGTHEYWEDRSVKKAFRDYDDAKAYVEENSASTPYPMRWIGKFRYSGRSVLDGKTEEGLSYILHHVSLS